MTPNTNSPPAFDIDIFAGDYSHAEPFGPYIRAKFQWKRNEATAATIQVKASHPHADRLKQCKTSVVPIRTFYNGKVWDGRVMDVTIEGKPGQETVTAICASNMKWLESILGWPMPLAPEWAQVKKQDIMIGPIDFVTKYFIAKNATRLNKPVYVKVPDGGNQIKLPTIPSGIDSVDKFFEFIASLDLCAMYTRMTPLDELFQNSLKSSESEITCNLWVKGDPDPGKIFNTNSLGRLQNIFDLHGDNFMFFTNPNNILGLLNPETYGKATEACYIVDTRKKRDRKWMQWSTDGGQIIDYKRNITHPTAHQVITGGQAPEWLNELGRILADGIIGLILSVFGAGFLAPSVGGLLDDRFGSFNKFNNSELEELLGRHGFGEAYANAQVAFTLDSLMAGLQGLRDHAGRDSIKIRVLDGGAAGKGFQFGADDDSGQRYQEGDIMSFVDGDTVITDYVSEVTVEDQRGGFCVAEVTIGDDQPVKDPFLRMVDKFKEFGSTGRVIATTAR
ncbi:Gp37-like protein [Rhodococcus qingshengii]|uniref:Gp37-like protein n=1 Tax=Rhodococcus qingshengii TaxID=334542 RepID=UPI00406394B5